MKSIKPAQTPRYRKTIMNKLKKLDKPLDKDGYLVYPKSFKGKEDD